MFFFLFFTWNNIFIFRSFLSFYLFNLYLSRQRSRPGPDDVSDAESLSVLLFLLKNKEEKHFGMLSIILTNILTIMSTIMPTIQSINKCGYSLAHLTSATVADDDAAVC